MMAATYSSFDPDFHGCGACFDFDGCIPTCVAEMLVETLGITAEQVSPKRTREKNDSLILACDVVLVRDDGLPKPIRKLLHFTRNLSWWGESYSPRKPSQYDVKLNADDVLARALYEAWLTVQYRNADELGDELEYDTLLEAEAEWKQCQHSMKALSDLLGERGLAEAFDESFGGYVSERLEYWFGRISVEAPS